MNNDNVIYVNFPNNNKPAPSVHPSSCTDITINPWTGTYWTCNKCDRQDNVLVMSSYILCTDHWA